jgi:hypothetical protein
LGTRDTTSARRFGVEDGHAMFKRTLLAIAVLGTATIGSSANAAPDGPYLESSTLPIRVFYGDDTAEAAPAILVAAEDAWAAEIDGLGFAPPLRQVGVDDEVQQGFDIVLDATLPGVAAYEIEGDNPDTAAADCPTFGYVNPDYTTTDEMRQMTLVHILNHGSLHAVDCLEPPNPAYDSFAVATEVVVMGSEHMYWLMSELPAFQAHPWFSIDQVYTPDVFYIYGSGLFLLFLDEVYGAGDGRLLPEIWASAAEDGTITSWSGGTCTADVENEPDYLDAVAVEIEALGSSFDEAFVLFTEYRFFVGLDDDGAHFEEAGEWGGSEVARDTVLAATDLPLSDGAAVNAVAEYGSSYVEIDPAGLTSPQEMTISFAGNPAKGWAARLFLVPAAGAATIVPFTLDAEQAGALTVDDASAWSRIVLATANLGDGDHDPDDSDWSNADGDYSYSIATPGFGGEDAGVDGGADADSDADADADSDAGGDAGADAGAGGGSPGCGCAAVGAPQRSGLIAALLAR